MPRSSPVSSKTKTQKSKEEEDNFGIIIKRVFYTSNSRTQFCSTTGFIYHSIVGMFGFRKLFVIMNAGSRCLACLLRLANHRNGLKCFYAMSILVATVTFLHVFGVIDHLKTLMETLPEQNCKEMLSQGELNINCSLINFESYKSTFHICLRVTDFRGVNRNSGLGWIVNTRNCKIPNMSVWDAEAFPLFGKKLRFSGCSGYNWSSLQGHVSRRTTYYLCSDVVPFPFRIAN
jgi:hypothetical protein